MSENMAKHAIANGKLFAIESGNESVMIGE